MQKLNLSKNEIAAFDIDAQQTFTPLCPDELPVAGGDMKTAIYTGLATP